MCCLEEENARTKIENTMLAEQHHDTYDKFDDSNNNDLKRNTEGEDKDDDRESGVRGTRRHGFRDQI